MLKIVLEFIIIHKMILDSEKALDFNKCPRMSTSEVEFKRKEIDYENLSARFTCLKKDFKKQFAHIYSGRLALMKERVVQACYSKWGKGVAICKLSELSDEVKEKCVVIGTIFKHQQLKPSILKELSEENQVMPQPIMSNFVSDSDQLILEDEIQRIRLVGNINIKKCVTGIVVGLLGFENNEGKFEVEDVCFAGVENSLEKPLLIQDDSYLVMVSGLKVGSLETAMGLELLIESIRGDLGSVEDQEKWAKVCRVLIAGNSVTTLHSDLKSDILSFDSEEGFDILPAVKELDDILKELLVSVEVDLMPGELDPSNHILPQQAIYDCVFPKASQYESFHCVTNPYDCKVGGRRILGTSGQTINNIKCVTDFDDSLDILEKTLLWGHLAPTAPDTLGCYPFYKEDPFIINRQPEIYFAGNQPEYRSKLINQNGCETRLICIPSFYKTQTCILVNLKTLECTPITFTT